MVIIPGGRVGDTSGFQGVFEAGGDLGEVCLAAGEEGVEVFQGAGVTPDVRDRTSLLGRGESTEGGESPQQFACLRHRQWAEVVHGQPAGGRGGDGEGVAAGDQQPRPARQAHPCGQERPQLWVGEPVPGTGGVGGEGVFGAVE